MYSTRLFDMYMRNLAPASYNERLTCLSIAQLELRHIYADLLLKILHGLVHSNSHFTLRNPTSWHGY